MGKIKDKGNYMPRQPIPTKKPEPKTLALGVHAPYNRTKNIDSYFQEFLNLIKTNDIQADQILFIRLREIDPATFITKGKIEEILSVCKKHDIQRIIISEQLSGVQERNLHYTLECEIIDRTRLILEIFQRTALSTEGKKQVEIALFKFRKTRLAGKGIAMAQQAGMIGGRGPGERMKELEARHIEESMLKLKEQLKKIQQTRATQRKRRLETQVPQICLIGYTNAGKSTILNTLTRAGVLVADKPFATLDTTTKELFINREKMGIISDTVGFIQNLPHQLIDAFKATLEELQYAHLLLQVIDISDPNWESHIQVVHEILEDLEVDKPMLYVFNKIDKAINLEQNISALDKYQPHVLVSALSRSQLQPLTDFLQTWKPEN